MQIGIRLHDIEKAPLETRLEIAARQGFSCGHLALNKVIDTYSTADDALTPGLAYKLKRDFEKNGLDVAVLGCYLNLANPNQEALKKNVQRYMAHIRFASWLQVGVVGTETGAVNEGYKFEPANHSEEALEIFIRNLRPIVAYAEKMGVVLAIEPVYKHIVCNPVRARKVLDEINSPNLMIILDPVNLLDISNYEKREEIFREAIELLGRDVAVLHLKDFVVEDNQLKSVGCGKGLMQYEQILSFIKKQKPFIHATLENTTPETAVASREYIEKIYNSLDV